MAFEFCDGCSHLGSGGTYPPAIPPDRKWTSVLPLGTPYATTPVRRTNPSNALPSFCMSLNSSNAWKTLTYRDERFMAAACYMNSADSQEQHFFQMLSGGQLIASLTIESDNTVSILANGTIIWNSAPYVWTGDAYHYCEWHVTLSGSTNIAITCDLTIDGNVLATAVSGLTGINNNSLICQSTNMNQIGIAGGRFFAMDILVYNALATDVNGNATTLNVFQGDLAIMDIVPDADVVTSWSLAGGSTRFGVLANAPPQDDVEYIYDDTVNDVDSVNMTPLTGITGTIAFVQLCIYAKKDAEGSRAIRAQLNTVDLFNWTSVGTTPVLDQYLSDYYDVITWPLDTLAGTPWTESNFNSAVWGVKVSV